MHTVVYQTFNSKEIMDCKLATIPETDEESENAVPKAQGNPSPVAAMGPPPSPGHPVLRHGGTTSVPPEPAGYGTLPSGILPIQSSSTE